jgi:hypothetical protein
MNAGSGTAKVFSINPEDVKILNNKKEEEPVPSEASSD